MKQQFLFLALLIFSFSSVAIAQKSPRMQANGVANGVTVDIDYSAPSVKERKVWGGLEAYDAVWRAGADKNTTISFDKAVKVGGENLTAGKYGFFIIPKKEGDWVAIFNKKNDGWGAYGYDQNEDALRLNIKPEWKDKNQEQLNYSVIDNAIVFAWEKLKLSLPISGQ